MTATTILGTETYTTQVCPACDPRAIGLPADRAMRVVHMTLYEGGALFKCGACGCIFNPGTTRVFVAKVIPVTMALLHEKVVRGAWCEDERPDAVTTFDVNYVTPSGEEQRTHGVRCDYCLGLVQSG